MFFHRSHLYLLLTSFLFIFLSFYITYPLVFHLGDFSTGYGDELLISWIHNWVIHSIVSGNILHIFQANIFYPYTNSLAFSDAFFTSSIVALIPRVIIGQPIATNNIVLIFSLCSLAFSVFLLTKFLTNNYLISIFSGALIEFSPAILDKKIHLQLLFVFFVPLSIWCIFLYIKTKVYRYFLLAVILFILQTYNSFLPGYFLLLFFSSSLFFILFYRSEKISIIMSRKNLITIIMAGVILLPLIIPYYQVSHQFNYVRDIRESIHLALQPEDLIVTNEHSKLSSFLTQFENPNGYPPHTEVKPGFLGGVLTVLAIMTLVYGAVTFRKKYVFQNVLYASALTSLILSFGPALHFHRVTIHQPFPILLPYSLLYYIVPGFQGFRNSSRWEVAFIIFIIPIIAIMLSHLLSSFSYWVRTTILFLLFFLVFVEYNFPMHFVSIPSVQSFPEAHQWIARTSPTAVYIEMPIYNWNMFPYASDELMRDYFTTLHFRKTVNGASGFSPPPWQKSVEEITANFPNEKSVSLIKNMGVMYIIVNTVEYDMLFEQKFKFNTTSSQTGKTVVDTLKKNPQISVVKETNEFSAFKIKD